MSVIKFFAGTKNKLHQHYNLLSTDQKQPKLFKEDWDTLALKIKTSPSIYNKLTGGEIQIVSIDLNALESSVFSNNNNLNRDLGIEYSFAFIPLDKAGNAYWGTGGWFILLCPRGDIDTVNGVRQSIVIEKFSQYDDAHIISSNFSSSDQDSALEKLAASTLPTSLNLSSFWSDNKENVINEEATAYFRQITELREAGLRVSLSGLEKALTAAGVEDLTAKELLALYHGFFL